MNLYIYTDESGVFDHIHNKYFVFGGVLYLSKNEKDIAIRKYLSVERTIHHKYKTNSELKANYISNSDKGKIFRSLNNTIKFGVIVSQQKVDKNVFNNKKSKQRYLDYAYKIMIKSLLKNLAQEQVFRLEDIENMYIFCDEHTTATDGRYELREGILGELKHGTFNYKFNIFYKPICPDIKSIHLNFYDSRKKPLIRAADIVANKIYYHTLSNSLSEIKTKVFLIYLP